MLTSCNWMSSAFLMTRWYHRKENVEISKQICRHLDCICQHPIFVILTYFFIFFHQKYIFCTKSTAGKTKTKKYRLQPSHQPNYLQKRSAIFKTLNCFKTNVTNLFTQFLLDSFQVFPEVTVQSILKPFHQGLQTQN